MNRALSGNFFRIDRLVETHRVMEFIRIQMNFDVSIEGYVPVIAAIYA